MSEEEDDETGIDTEQGIILCLRFLSFKLLVMACKIQLCKSYGNRPLIHCPLYTNAM